MIKKILSLLMSLSVAMAMVSNITMVSAADDIPKGFVKYYTDEAMQNEITSDCVDVGDIFYAAIGIDDFKACTAATFSIGFDSTMLNLVGYASDENVSFPDGGIAGSSYNFEDYGVRIFRGDLSVIKNNAMPSISRKPDRYTQDGEVLIGEESTIVDVSMYSNSSVDFTEPTVMLLLKLRAMESGYTELTFPKKINGAAGDYYTIKNGFTLAGTYGMAYIGVDADESVGLYNIEADNPTLDIFRNIPELMPPTNLRWEGNVAVWDDNNDPSTVSGYRVTIYRNGEIFSNSVLVGQQRYDFTPYMTMPGVYLYSVFAIGATNEYGEYMDSREVWSEEIYKIEVLDRVTDLYWDDMVLSWEHQIADTFELYLYNRTYEDMELELCHTFVQDYSYDFSNLMTESGEYRVKIRAISNDITYCRDSEWTDTVLRVDLGPVCNIDLIGTSETFPDYGFTQGVVLETNVDASFLVATIRYPETLSVFDILPIDFVEVSMGEEEVKDGYNYREITGVYDYNGNYIPKNTKNTLFEILFDVDESAPAGDAQIELSNISLIGESETVFDMSVTNTIKILHKYAEWIEIYGETEIFEPTQYYAEIYPYETTNKEVAWSVSDEEIATISDDGILTPIKPGYVTITATAKDGSGISATVMVRILPWAQISSLNFGEGISDKAFTPDERNYTVYVEADAEYIMLTPTYFGGVTRPDGTGIVASGRPCKFSLDGDVTEVTLVRSNVSGMGDSVYTFTVIRCDGMIAEETDENAITVIPVGANVKDMVIVALYDGARLITAYTQPFNGTVMTFETDIDYTDAKVMVWDSVSGMKPSVNAVTVE